RRLPLRSLQPSDQVMSTNNPQIAVDQVSSAAPPVESAGEPDEQSLEKRSLLKDLIVGVATQSWLARMAFHMVLMVALALILGTINIASTIGQAPEFESTEQVESVEPEITHFEVGYTPPDPSELTTETLMLSEAPSVEAQFNDNSPVFE